MANATIAGGDGLPTNQTLVSQIAEAVSNLLAAQRSLFGSVSGAIATYLDGIVTQVEAARAARTQALVAAQEQFTVWLAAFTAANTTQAKQQLISDGIAALQVGLAP